MKRRTASVICLAATLLSGTTAASADAQVPHTVEPGETLWSIAAQDGLSVGELAAANGLSPDAWLLAGTTVLIPPSSGATGTVTPEQVGSIAAEYGMSAPLVESIAWNESGFDNAAVSSAGARGVMQIMPDTWDFIAGQLSEQPLDAASAIDNVRAGVIYLHHLYHLKNGDGDATVASYYQGPNRDVLLPETRRYVEAIRADEPDFAGR